MRKYLLLLIILLVPFSVLGNSVVVKVYRTTAAGQGVLLGDVTLQDGKYGLLILPDLKGLTPGLHGMHVHANPSCDAMGNAAGGHFDPYHTDKHFGPFDSLGHLGDLPALYVDAKGVADLVMLAPRVFVSDVSGRALMIHAGGDNYSDAPEKLGGGGARIACGVVKP